MTFDLKQLKIACSMRVRLLEHTKEKVTFKKGETAIVNARIDELKNVLELIGK